MRTLALSCSLTLLFTCYQIPLQGQNPEVNKLDEKGFALLHRAAMSGREATVTDLLQKGANVDVRQKTYQGTPLQYATAQGHVEIIQLLLKSGATVDAMDSNHRTPLAWAVDKKQADSAKVLLEAGADVLTPQRGWSVLRRLKEGDDKRLMQTFDEFFSQQSKADWVHWKIMQVDFEAPRDGPEPGGVQVQMWHSNQPAMPIPDKSTAEDALGRLDVWLSDGIPKAVSSYSIRTNGKLFRSLALLRNEKVEAKRSGKFVWQPTEMDVPWKVLPDAGDVADSIDDFDKRTEQMTALSKRFSMKNRILKSEPIARYENNRDGYKVIDGGVFVLLRKGNPEGVVCIEARRGKINNRWHYAVARLTSPPGAILLDKTPVLEWTGYWAGPRTITGPYIEQFVADAPQER